tara:strand:- start:329 stop:1255 length:927 start_codon:yes stop_codon:yes gene_type:complete
MKKMNFSNGVDNNALRLQMHRSGRWKQIRHPVLDELCERYQSSLECIKFAPKKAFSIDMFPYTNLNRKNVFYKNTNWVNGSYLPMKTTQINGTLFSFFSDFFYRFFKRKIVFPKTINNFNITEASFDHIEALGVIPWVENVDGFLNEINRLLKPGGLFGFATFGPLTLKKFSEKLNQKLDNNSVRFIPMIDLHDLGDFCGNSGFEGCVVSSEIVSFKYQKSITALNELRALSGNSSSGRRKTLCGRKWYKLLIDALEECVDSSGLKTFEFEFIVGHAWKRESKTKSIFSNNTIKRKRPLSNEKKIEFF